MSLDPADGHRHPHLVGGWCNCPCEQCMNTALNGGDCLCPLCADKTADYRPQSGRCPTPQADTSP